MNRRWLAGFAVVSAAAAWTATPGAQGPARTDWLTDGGDPQRTAWQRHETILTKDNVKDMKQLNGGTLTNKDKAIVNHQQNELSRGIYSQKHDAQTQNTSPKTEIGQRKENQQDRIGQGIASGELTAGEASRLEGKETALNQETRDMRKLDGGKLTPGDKKLVNQQQDKLSKQIYNQKHDEQTQPD